MTFSRSAAEVYSSSADVLSSQMLVWVPRRSLYTVVGGKSPRYFGKTLGEYSIIFRTCFAHQAEHETKCSVVYIPQSDAGQADDRCQACLLSATSLGSLGLRSTNICTLDSPCCFGAMQRIPGKKKKRKTLLTHTGRVLATHVPIHI